MAHPSHRQRHVLIVDDDGDCSEAFQVLVQGWGCDAYVAKNPDDALALIGKRHPDAILVDLGLPWIEQGLGLVRQVRELPGGEEFLILAVTGHGRAEDRRRAIGAGCDFFFVKPPDLDEVHEALLTVDAHREWARRRRG